MVENRLFGVYETSDGTPHGSGGARAGVPDAGVLDWEICLFVLTYQPNLLVIRKICGTLVRRASVRGRWFDPLLRQSLPP